MEEVLKTFLQQHFYLHAIVIFCCFFGIIGGMVVDLIAGIRKAHSLGIATTSKGLEKTFTKAGKYFGPFMCAVFIDITTCIVIPIPAFSIIWAVLCDIREFKSVREKAWQKAEIRSQERTMQVILENKADLAKAIVEALKAQEKGGANETD